MPGKLHDERAGFAGQRNESWAEAGTFSIIETVDHALQLLK